MQCQYCSPMLHGYGHLGLGVKHSNNHLASSVKPQSWSLGNLIVTVTRFRSRCEI